MQHTATHCNNCNTLQHTATHCNTLQHTATHCNTQVAHTQASMAAVPKQSWWYVALCCTLLHCVALCCTVLHCVALCCTVLHSVALCYTLLHCVEYGSGTEAVIVVCCTLLRYGVASVRWIDKITGLFCTMPYERDNILYKRPVI